MMKMFKRIPSVLILLCLFNHVYGQTNKFKDAQLAKIAARKEIAARHIHETDIYLMERRDSVFTGDSLLISKLEYDRDGNLVSATHYSQSAKELTRPHQIYHNVYQYDHKGDLVKLSTTVDNYQINNEGTLIKLKGGNMSDQNIEYSYDDKNNLVAAVNDNKWMVMFNKAKLGYKLTVTYDAAGNVNFTKYHDPDGKPTSITEYDYDKKNQLEKSFALKGTNPNDIQHTAYSYEYSPLGMTKTELTFNHRDSLLSKKEYVYDLRGNQVKGYVVTKDAERLVLDFKYNNSGQLVESYGGPLSTEILAYQDVRRDGLAHLFYTYNNLGELIAIKKYNINPVSRKEELTAIEKIEYKTY